MNHAQASGGSAGSPLCSHSILEHVTWVESRGQTPNRTSDDGPGFLLSASALERCWPWPHPLLDSTLIAAAPGLALQRCSSAGKCRGDEPAGRAILSTRPKPAGSVPSPSPGPPTPDPPSPGPLLTLFSALVAYGRAASWHTGRTHGSTYSPLQ